MLLGNALSIPRFQFLGSFKVCVKSHSGTLICFCFFYLKWLQVHINLEKWGMKGLYSTSQALESCLFYLESCSWEGNIKVIKSTVSWTAGTTAEWTSVRDKDSPKLHPILCIVHYFWPRSIELWTRFPNSNGTDPLFTSWHSTRYVIFRSCPANERTSLVFVTQDGGEIAKYDLFIQYIVSGDNMFYFFFSQLLSLPFIACQACLHCRAAS